MIFCVLCLMMFSSFIYFKDERGCFQSFGDETSRCVLLFDKRHFSLSSKTGWLARQLILNSVL